MGSLTIERVTPKRTTNNRPYVLVEASGRTLSSWDVSWTNCVGCEVPESKLFQDKKGYWNLPDVADVFGASPAPLPQTNGIGAQQTANERFEILDRKVDAALALLREIRGKFA